MIFSILSASILMHVSQVPVDRTIQFSNYEWQVKGSDSPVGPGPNRFDSSTESVHVDAQGRLVLRIRETPKGWTCSEVFLKKELGYGKYTFTMDSSHKVLDDNMVLGLFVYADDEREIDVELSRWGVADAPLGQFVVQPYRVPGNIHRFEIPNTDGPVIYSFDWRPTQILFQAKGKTEGREWVEEWTYRGASNPKSPELRPHINLWLMQGLAPKRGLGAEVVISSFRFEPMR